MSAIHPKAHVDPDVFLGHGTIIRQFASVTGGAVFGEFCSIAPQCMIHGSEFGDRCVLAGGVMMGPGFRVGNDVFIGPNVTFCNDAWPKAHKEGFEPELFGEGVYAVIVDDGASIGANSVIMPGVRIGEGAMVAAGIRVVRHVPAHHVLTADGQHVPILEEPSRMRFAA